jgi:lysophospholipase L1-like esterase
MAATSRGSFSRDATVTGPSSHRVRAVGTIDAVRIAVVLTLLLSVLVPSRAGAAPVHYYLSVGDSLAAGYLAGRGDTDLGYADQLYGRLRREDPSLRLVKLGCDGETTTSMLDGGRCSYQAGSQLRQAVRFLQTHAGQVRYLTLDIGANDLAGCYSRAGVDDSCVTRGLRTSVGNLPRILAPLYAAAGPAVRTAGMTYYDPFLALWLDGMFGQLAAGVSVGLQQLLSGMQAAVYGAFGYAVADTFAAFGTTAFSRRTPTPYGNLPVAVANVCRLTAMCSDHDVHPTRSGYQVIARTFATALGVQ